MRWRLAWLLVLPLQVTIAQRQARVDAIMHDSNVLDSQHQQLEKAHSQQHVPADPQVVQVIRETIVLGNNVGIAAPTSDGLTAVNAQSTMAATGHSARSSTKDVVTEPANLLKTLMKLRALQPILVFAVHHPLRFLVYVVRPLPHFSLVSLRYLSHLVRVTLSFASRPVRHAFAIIVWNPTCRMYERVMKWSPLWTFLACAVVVGLLTGIVIAALTDLAPKDWMSIVGRQAELQQQQQQQQSNRGFSKRTNGRIVEPNKVEAVWEQTGAKQTLSSKFKNPMSMSSDDDSVSLSTSDSDTMTDDTNDTRRRGFANLRSSQQAASTTNRAASSVDSSFNRPHHRSSVEAWRTSSSDRDRDRSNRQGSNMSRTTSGGGRSNDTSLGSRSTTTTTSSGLYQRNR
ncbi:hypothetical protein OIO90_004175 [Microbotryomycetes sp. JL221]|nr:hypothetical protein OIO90_004175 [Microbotryomycetes sp. JL221]